MQAAQEYAEDLGIMSAAVAADMCTFALSAGYYDAYYRKAQKVRTLIKRDFEEAFTKVDVIVSPVSPNTAFTVGAHEGDPVAMYLEDVFMCAQPMVGIPAISVPCGFASPRHAEQGREAPTSKHEGLPIGVQIMGPQGGEETLIQAAHAYAS